MDITSLTTLSTMMPDSENSEHRKELTLRPFLARSLPSGQAEILVVVKDKEIYMQEDNFVTNLF